MRMSTGGTARTTWVVGEKTHWPKNNWPRAVEER
jgi:hypothetical protein